MVPQIESYVPLQEAIGGGGIAPERPTMPISKANGPMRSTMPISDIVEPNPAASIHTSQLYQQQQAYFEAVRKIDSAGVPTPGGPDGSLPAPYETTLPRSVSTLIHLGENGRKGTLAYNPYIYQNYKWSQPQEKFSFVW